MAPVLMFGMTHGFLLVVRDYCHAHSIWSWFVLGQYQSQFWTSDSRALLHKNLTVQMGTYSSKKWNTIFGIA
jgi:hypothetical protein